MATIDLTDETFEKAVSGDGIVIVDFWAEWCGPCRQFGPVFEKASEQHTDITFAKVDTEAQRGIAAAAQITSIPTLMAFRDGVLLFAQPGALPAPMLDELVGKLREVDMDEVHAKLAEQEAGN